MMEFVHSKEIFRKMTQRRKIQLVLILVIAKKQKKAAVLLQAVPLLAIQQVQVAVSTSV